LIDVTFDPRDDHRTNRSCAHGRVDADGRDQTILMRPYHRLGDAPT